MSPSPQEVEDRLRQLGELHRLSMSLTQVSGVLLTQMQMLRRSLRLRGPRPATEPMELWALVQVAGAHHRVGEEYSVLVDTKTGRGRKTHALLVGIWLHPHRSVDVLPPKADGQVLVRFVESMPTLSSDTEWALVDEQTFRLAGGVVASGG